MLPSTCGAMVEEYNFNSQALDWSSLYCLSTSVVQMCWSVRNCEYGITGESGKSLT